MKSNRPWFYFGVISGFLFGFFCFAYGVYTHGKNVHDYDSIVIPGTTIRN
ncbi:hypothetical protein [Legionella yabuuchiae]|nr:hypothetical protein [Legionella yabuuchiae]